MRLLERFRTLWLAALAALLAAAPAESHHSFAAEFDAGKKILLQGRVTKVEWRNPHTYFYVDVKEAGGAWRNWACETSGPNSLERLGWNRKSLQVGDRVRVVGYRARDGASVVSARSVILPDGRRMFAASPYDGGPRP